MTDPDLPFRQHVSLKSGLLTLAWAQQDRFSLDDLTSFAVRRNPRRGFLFVSKVLGRHWPVAARTQAAVTARLADRIAPDIEGPVVMIGMAETAVALGAGVFEAYAIRTGREDLLYLHTTRFRLRHRLLLSFQEGHSHASRHLLYQPPDPLLAQRLHAARTVILIDDEISSGDTMVNLAHALVERLPSIRRLITVSLMDWSLGPVRTDFPYTPSDHTDRLPRPGHAVRLILGSHRFEANPGLVAAEMPAVEGNGADKTDVLPVNDGRLGIGAPVPLAPSLAARVGPARRGRVLVLGNGEFVHRPARLAQALEAQGHQVWCQAITRSPVQQGGAIRQVQETRDPVDDGIPHWIYNVDRSDYDKILICYETPPALAEVQAPLWQALAAEPVFFSDDAPEAM